MPFKRIFYGWWVILVTAFSIFVLTGSGVWTFAVLVKPMTQDLKWSNAQLIGVFTLAGILSALVSPLFGRFVDKYGTRPLIPIFLFLFGICLFFTSYVQTLWQFYLLYGVGLGLGRSAVVQVGAPAVMANWFIRKRGIAFASISMAVGISGVLFVQLAQGILDWFDWRMVWRSLGLFIIAIPVPLAWVIIRSKPESMGLFPDGDGGARRIDSQTNMPDRNMAAEEGWTLKDALRTRPFWVINLAFLLITFPASSLIIVMHAYLTDIGISSSTAAQAISFYAVAVIIGSIVSGFLCQWLSARLLLVPFAVFYGLSIVCLIAIGNAHVILLYATLLAMGIGVVGIFQVGIQIWADYYGRKEIGSIIGAHMFVRLLAGAPAPLILALIRDSSGGYLPGFQLYAILCFVAGVMLLFAPSPRKLSQVGMPQEEWGTKQDHTV